MPNSPTLAGLHAVGRERWAARLKRSVVPGAWILLDADDAPGMPEEMRRLDVRERLAAFERILPGITRAERILSRSSSFRVRRTNQPPRRAGHAWLRVSDATKIEMLRIYLTVATVTAGLAFLSPRYSRETGEVIGHAWRTLFDLSVLVPGRLVFGAEPILDDSARSAGYVLDEPGIVIENAGGGVLDVGAQVWPSNAALADYNRRTGTHTTLTRQRGGTSIGIHVRGVLGPDTPIESRGVTRPLAEWLEVLRPDEKLRCEAPFRASASEAAFLVKHGDGSARVFDIGVGTTWLWPGPHRIETGEPGERAVIGTDHQAISRAAMLGGIGWTLRMPDTEQLGRIWLPDEVRDVVVVWPGGASPELRLALVARLRRARKIVTVVEGG